MAHYKRGKCRRDCPKAIRGSDTSWRARYGFRPVRIILDRYELGTEAWRALWRHPRGKSYLEQMSSYPAWWDRTFHTRPKRAATRRLERQMLAGADPDAIAWPLASNRPHQYYW